MAGNALSMAAMRATLGEVMTDDAFERMIALGERFEEGVRGVIESRALPWHVVRLGCRVEYLFRPDAARTGSEAAAGQDEELDQLIHLYLLNRGMLITPFHNMALHVARDDRPRTSTGTPRCSARRSTSWSAKGTSQGIRR